LILLHPHYLAGGVLFRAIVPQVPDLIRDLSHLSVFIGAARLAMTFKPPNIGCLAKTFEEKSPRKRQIGMYLSCEEQRRRNTIYDYEKET
jgi:hypothetical protein